MFKKLFDLGYKRNTTEALEFYLVYFVLILIGSAVVTYLIGAQDFQRGLRAGTFFAATIVLALSLVILSKRRLVSHLNYLLLGLFSVVLAVIGGALLGLIPLAVLSTKGQEA